jgi:hypothetical protein
MRFDRAVSGFQHVHLIVNVSYILNKYCENQHLPYTAWLHYINGMTIHVLMI